jgi:hypothetical protein
VVSATGPRAILWRNWLHQHIEFKLSLDIEVRRKDNDDVGYTYYENDGFDLTAQVSASVA